MLFFDYNKYENIFLDSIKCILLLLLFLLCYRERKPNVCDYKNTIRFLSTKTVSLPKPKNLLRFVPFV